MNRRNLKLVFFATAVAALVLLAAACWRLTSRDLPAQYNDARHLPRIRPDYIGTVIPPNVAPLNFLVEEPGAEFRVRIHGTEGRDILISSRSPDIIIPLRPWRELLDKNRGDKIGLDIYVKSKDGHWSRFDMIENAVAREGIDSHLVYRLLGPVCNGFRKMGIYQRNLENYDESPIVANDRIGDGCVNCHSFQNNRPDLFSFHVRPALDTGKSVAGMILVRDGHAIRLQTKSKAAPELPGYLSWHPSGSLVAFSMSKPRQVFRAAGAEIRDVFDLESDLAVMNIATCAASTSSGIADPNKLETFPNWSADGKTLHFCSARSLWGHGKFPAVEDIGKVKFDLMRVQYDVKKNIWGRPETVLAASETGKSILEPRASPDGRYLLFCMTDYGGFPIHQAGCDLYMMDLKSGKYRRLECNSDRCDSWHCWSSNSRWIVFSSKRDNGLLARPYFSYIDSEGREHKPFLLPQKDPTFYDFWLRTYNVPELVKGPVTIPQEELVQAILSGNTPTNELPKPVHVERPDNDLYTHE